MTRQRRWLTALGGLAALVLLGAGPGTTAAAHPDQCNRTCLLSSTNTYLEAVLHNDIARLKLAPNVRSTDLGRTVAVGHGTLWGAAVRMPYRQTWADAGTHSTMFFGTATNGAADTWWWYEVRLTFAGDRIAEVEEIEWAAPANSPSPPGGRATHCWTPRFRRVSAPPPRT